MGGVNANKVEIGEILLEYYNANLFLNPTEAKNYLYYTYDMGDNWIHAIHVQSIEHANSELIELIDGGGACPPEDCGGVGGYKRIKSYLEGEISAEEYYDWFTAKNIETFDPNHFDIEATNLRLMKYS